MKSLKQVASAAAIGAALMIGAGPLVSQAQAAYVVTLTETGGNVVANGSGSLDTTDLFLAFANTTVPIGTAPSVSYIATGASPPSANADLYTGSFVGPANFGIGTGTNATTSSGDVVGFTGSITVLTFLLVPVGYTSGASLSDTATYAGETFATLGVTPGTYVYTFGTGANADSFTVQIGPAAAVPEPASLALLGTALAGLLLAGTVRRIRPDA